MTAHDPITTAALADERHRHLAVTAIDRHRTEADIELVAGMYAEQERLQRIIDDQTAKLYKRDDEIDAAVGKIAAVTADRDDARHHLAVCQDQIAGLEREAGFRVEEVRGVVAARDRFAAKVRELEARPVLTVERLVEAMAMGPGAAAHVMAKLGAVTLPSQDRAEEMANAYVDEWNGNNVGYRGDANDIARRTAAMSRALAKLGAPATKPVCTGKTAAPAECHECDGNGVILGGSDGQGHQEEWPCQTCASENVTVGRYVQAMMLAVDEAGYGIKGDPQPPSAGRLWPMQWNAAARAAIKLGVPSPACTRAASSCRRRATCSTTT